MKKLALAALWGTAFAVGTSAHAGLIATDSFHTTEAEDTYEDDTRLMLNGVGLVGQSGFVDEPWSTGPPNWLFTSDLRSGVGSLNHDLVTGDSMAGRAFTTTGPATRGVSRGIDYDGTGYSPDGESAYYLSFLMEADGERTTGMGVRSEQRDNDAFLDDTTLGGVSVGFDGNDLAVWVNGISSTIMSGSTFGETYFSLVEIVNNGTENADTVNVSIFDSTNTDIDNPTASISVTDQDVTGLLNYAFVIKNAGSDENQTYFDEFRFGTTLDSVASVESTTLAGDMNNDGVVDVDDINPFVLAIEDGEAYTNQYGLDPADAGDINGDDQLDVDDVNPFVALLEGGEASAVPEPATLSLLALGSLGALGRRRMRRQ